MAPELVDIAAIEAAAGLLEGSVHRTPLRRSTTFSRMTNADVHLKLENLQRTGSFKIRGALNKMATLTKEEAARGVIAASAGNHAQGVALAAATHGISATIVMPQDAPMAKVKATEGYGGRVILHGDDFNAAFDHAQELRAEHGYVFVHPFNDPAIIAGQGTVGLEIVEALPDVDTVVCSIGGGGLISGIAAAVKARRPGTRIIGVEAEGAASAHASRAAGKLVRLDSVATIADGISTKAIGDLTFAHLEAYVDEIVTVSDAQIAHAILMLLERGKTVVEGAGAASLAALLSGTVDVSGQKVACVISGGNIDITMIADIVHRGLLEEGRLLRFATIIADKPGALSRILDRVASLRGNIKRVHHDRELLSLRMGQTLVDLEIETRGPEHAARILKALEGDGYDITLAEHR